MARPVSRKNSWTARNGSFKKSSKPADPRNSMLPYPYQNPAMKGLTAIAGIRVGHASNFDALTGCTAILCEGGAVCGVDIRGSASGTEEIEALRPGHVNEQVHAIELLGWRRLRACGVTWSNAASDLGRGRRWCPSCLARFCSIWELENPACVPR